MLALVIVLAGTTVLALAALVVLVARPPSWLVERALGVDPSAAATLERTPRPPAATGSVRRLISIEILNVRELAATRGRLAGLAGSLAPALTRRIVYDQTLKILNQQLVEQQVRADVRLHVIPVDQAPV
ncbi:hypothetical protein [uncultured Jatrophihabitans sp.]|uniref:hypothetical protein n=1 Tax=uncultured Jatrophihabitans sp. TaxID=1610747 RepID=UPI0035C97EFA